MPTQTFFIPKRISELRLSKLPLSASLFTVLRKLNVETFGDLGGMAIRDFQRVSSRGAALFAEMTGLTQRARNGDFAGVFEQNGGLLSSTMSQKPRVAVSVESAVKKAEEFSAARLYALPSQAPTDERIFIPQDARGTPIATFQISVRLWHVLEYKRFRILGDIHGISYAEFRQFRNCGKKTVTELRELVRQIQRTHPSSRMDGVSNETSEPFVALTGDSLNVPASVRDLEFCDLPVPVRLENILEKRKAIRLGDLNGVSVTELKGIGNCGKKTIADIVNLIEKAATGEFKTAIDANVGWSPVNLASLLDVLISELSARDAKILEMRLSGEKEQLPTLEDIGAKFKLTRERIRQVVKTTTDKLQKVGSRRLDAYLLQTEKVCRETVCPLTPGLFARWLGDKVGLLRFSPGFYVRLLCELNPSIPAWHGRQETPVKEKVAGALMPDAHVGYGLPIGGVLATENAVIPYAVGVDIACRMKMTVLDIPVRDLENKQERLTRAIEAETRFGIGANFKERRSHDVLDADWSVSPITKQNKDKAWSQLGTSGSGNHFVEFGLFTAHSKINELEAGTYVALLSHSGSRGTGAAVCDYYSKIAFAQFPDLPSELKRLAWLSLDSQEGQEYWNAMELMGEYAAANHACIHRHIAENLGATVLLDLENHHNFAWKEKHIIDGAEREVIVHRKGATPAGAGVLGIIPGSMASPGFVVSGKGNCESLNSCSHGAGRAMSRKAANEKFNWKDVNRLLRERGVTLISAGLDEVPMAYKNIREVMAAQNDLVTVLGQFDPKLVKMAPSGERPED